MSWIITACYTKRHWTHVHTRYFGSAKEAFEWLGQRVIRKRFDDKMRYWVEGNWVNRASNEVKLEER